MRRYLVVILAVYWLLGAGYLLSVPLWEAPDEPAHFLYAHTLAETGELPQRPQWTPGGWLQNATSNYEWHQPPLYYWFISQILEINRAAGILPPFQEFAPIIATPYRVFAPLDTLFTEVHLARLFSLFLGMGTIVTIYATSLHLAPREPLIALVAAGFAGMIPQFLFMHVYINNDTLAILASTAALFALIRVASSPVEVQLRDWAIAGAILAVAIIVKLTTWFLLGTALVLGVAMILVGRTPLRRGIAHLAIFALLAFAGLLIHWLVWLDFFSRLFDFQSGRLNLERFRIGYLVSLVPMTYSSYWGRFGWMNLPTPVGIQAGLGLITMSGLTASLVTVYRFRYSWSAERWLTMLVFLSAMVLNLVAFWIFNLATTQPQGRFFFPTLSVIAIASAFGWLRMAGKYRQAMATTIIVGMVAINIFILIGVIWPTYGLGF